MNRIKEAAKCSPAIFMIAAGIMHFVNPSLFRSVLLASTPDAVMYAIGLCEILIGVLYLRSVYSGFHGCENESACSTDAAMNSSTRPDPEGVLTAPAIQELLKEPERSNLLLYETIDGDGGTVAAIELQQYEPIDEVAAEILSRHKGDLGLQVRSISDGVARALGKHTGGRLMLNFLTEISNSAAESLSQHRGELFLRGLRSLSDAAAVSLSKHQYGGLYLKSLECISDEAARRLAQHTNLELDLTLFPESAARILREHGYRDDCPIV